MISKCQKKRVEIYEYFDNDLNLKTLIRRIVQKEVSYIASIIYTYDGVCLKNINPLYSKYLLFDSIRDMSCGESVQVILFYVISKIHCSAKIKLAINVR